MQTIIENKSLEDLWKKSISECEQKVLENVVLNGEFDIEEINSRFIQLHKEEACMWQSKKKPDELIINHGEYINKGNASNLGIKFIIQELKKKTSGNRACYSLINMEDIVNSGDKAIPSFMVLQFSFATEDKDKLIVSAYFRALEVKEFLPINLAEICLNIEEIKQNFPNIKTFELTIFIFRAQYIENFYCLRHSKLDTLKASTMVKYLLKDKKQIIDALRDKYRVVESVIITRGIENLIEAVGEVDEVDLHNRAKIKNQLSRILSIMSEIRTMRENTSIQEEIDKKTEHLNNELHTLIKFMEEKQ